MLALDVVGAGVGAGVIGVGVRGRPGVGARGRPGVGGGVIGVGAGVGAANASCHGSNSLGLDDDAAALEDAPEPLDDAAAGCRHGGFGGCGDFFAVAFTAAAFLRFLLAVGFS